jgi:hypothetical protein
MRDRFEDLLTDRLHDLAGTVPDEITAPADLEWRVARYRRRSHRWVRVGAAGVAAALLSVVAVLSVVHRSPERATVGVQAPDAISKAGRLKPNVALLDARGRYVVALDAAGHQADTLVVAGPDRTIRDVQVTADHQSLWYLSTTTNRKECGRVVRADIGTGASTVVADASAFAVSPDGLRLAYSGPCEGASREQDATTTVRNLGTGAEELHHGEIDVQLAFAPDGRSVITRTCSGHGNCGFLTQEPLASLTPDAKWYGECTMANCGPVSDASAWAGNAPFAIAPGGVYVIGTGGDTVEVRAIGALKRATVLLRAGKPWVLQQVLPTRAGVFVVASYAKKPLGLYRLAGKKLVLVREYKPGELGKLTPVLPLG